MLKIVIFLFALLFTSNALAQDNLVDLQTPEGSRVLSSVNHIVDTCALRSYPFLGKAIWGTLKTVPTKSKYRKVRMKLVDLKLSDGKKAIAHTKKSKNVFRCIRTRLNKKRFHRDETGTFRLEHKFPEIFNGDKLHEKTTMRILHPKMKAASKHCGLDLKNKVSLMVGTDGKVRSIVTKGEKKDSKCLRRYLIQKQIFPELKHPFLIKVHPKFVDGRLYHFETL